MAAQEKQDWNIKDNDAISDLRIHNVEVSDKLLGTGLFGTVNEAAWYGTPCAVKKAHAKFLDSSTCDSKFLLGRVSMVYICGVTLYVNSASTHV